MRGLIALITLWPLVSFGQSSFYSSPPCPSGEKPKSWNACVGSSTQEGHRYVGEWHSGMMYGWGRLTYPDGSMYVGKFFQGVRDGEGILYTKAGQVESAGVWNQGRLSRKFSPDSYTFQDAFFKFESDRGNLGEAQGQKSLPPCDPNAVLTSWTNCHGTATYADGSKYVGEYKDGKRHGQGSITWTSGAKYDGEHRNDKFHGQGTITWTSGVKYVGEFRDDKFHGQGVYTKFADKYVGEFRNGKFHGRGIFSYGRITTGEHVPPQEGLWQDGVFVRSESIPDHIAGRNSTKEPQVEKDNETTTSTDQVQDLTPSISQTGNEKIQARNEKRVALVIGNASYKTAPLDNPINDATDIANELKRRGFKVITRNNANLGSLRQAVRTFSDEFKKSDVGLIYYSGHGVEAKGENYLIPVDADIRKEYELSAQAYPASQLTAMMEEVQSSDNKKRVAILILDACRDNPLTRSWRSSGRGLARMDAPAGTFISFSTAPGSVAADGRGRNSPFTKHLLQAMRKPDVPIELMFKEVRVGVMGETKGEQIPWDSSSLTGDFFFSRSTNK